MAQYVMHAAKTRGMANFEFHSIFQRKTIYFTKILLSNHTLL